MLTWIPLPSGHGFFGPQMLDSGRSRGTRQLREDDASRMTFIHSLGPERCYEGSYLSETLYHVAVFPYVAIAETAEWGHALYYCRHTNDSWQTVFRKTKKEALDAGARRIIHSGDWRSRVRRLL
jgi:hypothetical protein